MDFKKIFINGAWCHPVSRETIEVINPANNRVIAEVPACADKDIDNSVLAAQNAFELWSTRTLSERISMLKTALSNLQSFRNDLISITVAELGSPVQFTTETQVNSCLKDFNTFLETAENTAFEEKHDGYTLFREPVGVVACICPWNYPLYQLIQKVIPALICGNTVVLKPASNTPLSSFYFAEAINMAGLPAGTFNLITGHGSTIGDRLSSHPRIDMVSFTGSTAVGRSIASHAAGTVKKLALELGGKSPCLVLENADLNLAVDTVLDSCFYNSGQTCSAFTRMFIPESKSDEIIKIIRSKLNSYRVGDPSSEDSVLGPLSSSEQAKIVNDYIALGISEGAKLITGSTSSPPNIENYVSPCVFTGVKNDMKIAKEEIFGPVLCVIEYDNIDEAINECNNTIYGLSSCIFGEPNEAQKIAKKIRAGNVHINDSPFVFNAPFGGYKQSGIGRESGLHGLLEFTELKAVFH